MKKHWIAGAISHPGAFKKQAEEAGKSTQSYAEEKAEAPGKTGKRARLALTLMNLKKKKKVAPIRPDSDSDYA